MQIPLVFIVALLLSTSSIASSSRPEDGDWKLVSHKGNKKGPQRTFSTNFMHHAADKHNTNHRKLTEDELPEVKRGSIVWGSLSDMYYNDNSGKRIIGSIDGPCHPLVVMGFRNNNAIVVLISHGPRTGMTYNLEEDFPEIPQAHPRGPLTGFIDAGQFYFINFESLRGPMTGPVDETVVDRLGEKMKNSANEFADIYMDEARKNSSRKARIPTRKGSRKGKN